MEEEEGNSLMHFASTSPSFPVPVSRSPVPKLAPTESGKRSDETRGSARESESNGGERANPSSI